MLKLNKEIKKIIEKQTGIDVETLSSMDCDSVDKNIEQKSGHKLSHYNSNDPRLQGRGSAYIFLNRLLNKNNLDKKLSRIK